LATQKTVIYRTNEKIILPDQSPTQIGHAFATADSLGGTLATFKETISNTHILEIAKANGYSLAVDPKDLPRQKGWYQIVRDNDTRFKPISEKEAESFTKDKRWGEVLCVNENAVNAARDRRPVLLGVSKKEKFIFVLDSPKDDGLVVIKPYNLESPNNLAKHLRLAKGDTLEVTAGVNEKLEITTSGNGKALISNVYEAKVLERKNTVT